MILSFSKTWPWNDEPTDFIDKIKGGRKIHTIREDKHERWREDMDIHFATGVRTPDYNQFHSDVCRGVQEIEINPKFGLKEPAIHVDGTLLPPSVSWQLVYNDGFDSWAQFNKWFDEDFEGRLIHWTDMRY